MDDRCRREVEELHRFFADWFTGALADDDAAFARLGAALADDFEIVSPDGRTTARQALLTGLRRAHRSRGPGFRIRVDGYRGRQLSPELLLATYQEWHEDGAERRGRLSSALFGRRSDGPNGVTWLHVHETWLPGAGPPAGPTGTS